MVDSLKEVEEEFKIKLSDLNYKSGKKPSLAFSKVETPSLGKILLELIALVEQIKDVQIKNLEGSIKSLLNDPTKRKHEKLIRQLRNILSDEISKVSTQMEQNLGLELGKL